MIFSCPSCRGPLDREGKGVACSACGNEYPRVGPILDLRLPGPSWIDYEADRAKARHLLALGPEATAETLVRTVFGRRPGWTDEHVERRTRQALDAVDRLRDELRDWLAPFLSSEGPLVDLGCGAGQLVAAAAGLGQNVIGLDVSLEWLVVADRMVQERGAHPTLVAALAESLPFGNGTVSTVLSLDVIEHVGDQPAYLREIARVLRPGGSAVFTTPNRFSLAAEPHVGVWGVGWLPRKWQARYVASRTSLAYEFVRLLGAGEIRRLVRRETDLAVSIRIPPIPAADLRRFGVRRRALARFYNLLSGSALTRWVFHAVGPFFRVIARKPVGAGATR